MKRLLWVFVLAGAIMMALIPVNFYLLESVSHIPEGLRDASNRNFVAIVLQQSLTVFNVSVSLVTLLILVQISKHSLGTASTKEDFKLSNPGVPDEYLDQRDGNPKSTLDDVIDQEKRKFEKTKGGPVK